MNATHALAAVLGMPAAHSLSPVIHGYWLRRRRVAASYVPIEIRAEDLAAFFALAPRIGFRGFNVTAPHKEAAYALCDRRSEVAERSGSVNLVVFDADGVFGDSTDGYGFLANLAAETGFDAASKTVSVVGAGGAAKALVDALALAGAAEIRVANRTPSRAEEIAARFRAGVTAFEAWPAEERFFEGADLIINATSYGMKGEVAGAKPWRLPALPPETIAAELIYAPLETVFLADAVASGARPVDGLGMLLHQARPSFEAWFGVAVDVDAGLRVEVMRALDELAARERRAE